MNVLPHSPNKNLRLRKIAACLGAALIGGGTFLGLAPALSAQDSTVTMCFRNRTMQVPSLLVSRYQAQGGTIGPCPVSPSA